MGEGELSTYEYWLIEYGWIVIVVQLILLIGLIILSYYLFRRKREITQESKAATVLMNQSGSLLSLIQKAREENPKQTLNVVLGGGDFSVEEEMLIKSPTRFSGAGTQETRIIAEGKHPAITIQGAKDCAISNVRVDGGIRCSNGELLVENCHIVAQDDGICIEAEEGSIITFSGMIRGEGGIAVRAMGESKVVLKPPYAVSGEDYVVLDPKSSITMEDQSKSAEEATENDKKAS